MKIFKLSYLIIAFFLFFNSLVYSRSLGPPDGYAGEPPNFQTCYACHNSYAANSGGGFIRLDGLPSRYQPGQSYDLTLVLYDQNQYTARWGFELTARHANMTNAGTLVITDALNTQLSQERENSPIFIKQTLTGNFSGTRGSVTWRFGWIAPPSGSGAVVFYYAGLAANGNSNVRNDYVYNRSTTSMPVQEDAPYNDELSPNNFKLISIYPNPFNNNSKLLFEIPYDGIVEVNMFNSLGNRQLFTYRELKPAGLNLIYLNPEPIPSGTYYIIIKFGENYITRSAIFIK